MHIDEQRATSLKAARELKGYVTEASEQFRAVVQNGRVVSGMTPRDRIEYARGRYAKAHGRTYMPQPAEAAPTLAESMQMDDEGTDVTNVESTGGPVTGSAE